MPVLTFPNGRKQYAVQSEQTGEIIKRNAQYPTAQDGGPISGLDPDWKYLEMHRDVQPDYDPRCYALGTVETVKEVEGVTVFHIGFTTTKRPSDDLKAAAKNVESLMNQEHVETSELLKFAIIGLGILFKYAENQVLSTPEEEVKTRLIGTASALRNNDARLTALFQAIDNGEDIDLDSGWEPSPTTQS